MAELDVTVAGRSYRLACDDGQEAHLLALAATLDAEARALSAGGGVAGEARLLLMTALMMADRLHDAQSRIADGADQRAAAGTADAAMLEEAVDKLEAVISAPEAPQRD